MPSIGNPDCASSLALLGHTYMLTVFMWKCKRTRPPGVPGTRSGQRHLELRQWMMEKSSMIPKSLIQKETTVERLYSSSPLGVAAFKLFVFPLIDHQFRVALA